MTHDNAVVVYTLTPSLERWTLQRATPSPHRAGSRPNAARVRAEQRAVARRTDSLLLDGRRQCDPQTRPHHRTTRDPRLSHPDTQPGDLIFVADPARSTVEDGGWLIALLHQDGGSEASLVVLDAADLARRPVATVHIPRQIPAGRHALWIPSTR